MIDIGKLLVGVGVIVVVVGVALMLAGKVGVRGMPGDLRYESPNVRFYFPVVTCLMISVAITLGMWAWRWFTRR